ncbi:MAG: sigma-70 family RNA polymerase sigma factor [Treponema sp.]|nr:sigma-70 family RNA polymerase sigma factor [Treponema sp.]
MKIDIEDCYKKYAPMIYRRCSGLLKNEEEALDAVQDVFVNLLRNKSRLHGQFLSSLLYTIATNICLNKLKRRKLQGYNCEDTQELLIGSNDPQLEKVEADMIMEEILQNESESTRAICFMYYGDGLTLQEIGEITGLSVSGVRKRLIAFKTRVKLKWEGEL